MKLRSKAMGQTPFVSQTCVDTELAVTAVFARAKSTTIGAETGAFVGGAPSQLQFKLGL